MSSKWVYYRDGRSVLAKSPDHLASLPTGWKDSPADFADAPAGDARDSGVTAGGDAPAGDAPDGKKGKKGK